MAKNANRDEFSPKTKLRIAKQAGWLCSDPNCRRPTVGASSDGESEILVGEASHICAASPGGPRYDPGMSREERRSAKNGIWMCKLHGTSVDSDDPKFTVELLREWKAQAVRDSHRSVLYNDVPHGPARVPEGDLEARVHAAATEDIGVFRRSEKWPSTNVALTVQMKELDKPVRTSALATAVKTLGDLILIAPPGMGKTSTLFQVSEGLLAQGESPIFVPLADWATENSTLLESVLKRATFRGKVTEKDFRIVAQKPGVFLLLDGWNELDSTARRRATTELKRLQADLPELGLFVSTRRQALDVPFEGARVDLQPLNEAQQMEIARVMRGDDGARIVDQAWRTPGVRELVTIPLYLTTLLSLLNGQPFPTTKDEILRRFVEAHEERADRAESLKQVTHGFQTDFLNGLAVMATRAANTSIPETSARRSIVETDDWLVADGQLTIKPQPSDVLDALVSHHVLVRTGDPAGYSFQHQQFQEWYASSKVERVMLESVGNANALEKLKTDILNNTDWEESILFAVERMSRGEEEQQEASAAAILAAFAVDPILAAEMIFRATDAVWVKVAEPIQKYIRNWHTPGRIDRSLRFMITSGRTDFLDLIWPLITAENDQKSLPALRAARRFRPSVLGPDAVSRIRALPVEVRKTVLQEIAFNSGMDGLDLATSIAKVDSDPGVKAAVVDALSFRRADRHVADVLSTGDDATFDLVYLKGHLEEIDDKAVLDGLAAARARAEKKGVSEYDRLRVVVYTPNGKDQSKELAELVATIEIDRKQDAVVGLIYEARKRYAGAVVQGLIQRLRNGCELFYGADDVLAASGIVLEDDALLEMALESNERHDQRAEAAASVLGPAKVGKMIDAMFEVIGCIRKHGKCDNALSDRYYGLRDRIAHTPGASLVAAIQERAGSASNEDIRELADLLSRRREEEGEKGERGRPFDRDSHAAIGKLAEQWGERLIASGDSATRSQLVAVADMIGHSPSVALLPTLKRLLDDELRRYRAFREQATASGWRQCDATNEARMLHTNRYQQALTAIKAPETTSLMVEYLPDEHFGETAARVLKVQWIEAHEPRDVDGRFQGNLDFSRVEERRAVRAARPTLTCAEAEAIFDAIEPLIAAGASDVQNKHAVRLGIQAARLPHGERADAIQALLSLAPQAARANLVLNLVLSGETIPFAMVKAGIDDVFEDAKKYRWILTEGGWQLKAWLKLLPFTDHPLRLAEMIKAFPEPQRDPHFLEEMIRASESAPSAEVEEALFKLAENDASFYGNHAWRSAILRRGTESSAWRYLDLVMDGKIEVRGHDGWHLSQELAGLLNVHPEVRAHAYALLKEGHLRTALLARAISEGDDPEGLLLLVELENKLKRPLISWRTIRGAVTEHVPSDHWEGAFDVLPVPATELRQKLLAMTTDGGPNDAAARVLREIDRERDESGTPEGEPRHPDLESGKPWPIMTPEPDADDGHLAA
jgi:hypothetical protein